MSEQSEQKIIQYLYEAQATEAALVQTLTAHIAMTPSGRYRDGLERHLGETERHAERVGERLSELGEGRSALQAGLGVLEGLVGQVVSMSKAPLDLLRGASGEEKLLKNAKDECASEALEIATYTAIQALAEDVGDQATAKLAGSILKDEQRMLDQLLKEIPRLSGAVVGAEIRDEPTYKASETGAADAARAAGRGVKKTAKAGARTAKGQARQARKVPGVARVEGEVKGAVAAESDLPITGYDDLTSAEVSKRLTGLSQIDLSKIDAYERKGKSRNGILDRVQSLRGDEPWPGYDELSVSDVQSTLRETADSDRDQAVRDYERKHKDRAGVLAATEREPAKS